MKYTIPGAALNVANTWTAAQTFSATVDMANNIITNIGAAGTDFSTTGGLTLAGNLRVDALVGIGSGSITGMPLRIRDGVDVNIVMDGVSAVPAWRFVDDQASLRTGRIDATTLAIGGDPDLDTGKVYKVATVQVVGAQGATVADASGGATIDAEARTALNALLARLRTHGLIAT